MTQNRTEWIPNSNARSSYEKLIGIFMGGAVRRAVGDITPLLKRLAGKKLVIFTTSRRKNGNEKYSFRRLKIMQNGYNVLKFTVFKGMRAYRQ